jgi:hypothetical protein
MFESSTRQRWRRVVIAVGGALHAKRGHMDTAMEYQRKSIALREALASEGAPGDLHFHSSLASAYKEMADPASEPTRLSNQPA